MVVIIKFHGVAMMNIELDKIPGKAIFNLIKITYRTIKSYDKLMTAYGPIHDWEGATQTDIEAYTAMIEFAILNTNADGRALHSIWQDYMTGNGWVHGSVINEIEKTHPDIMTFTFIPEASRAKYAIIAGLITSIAKESFEQ